MSIRTAIATVLSAATTAVVGAPALPAAPDALVCSPPSAYRRTELKDKGLFAEDCRDAQGLKQGPYRFKRISDGSTEIEGTYVDDQQDGPSHAYAGDGTLLYATHFHRGTAGETQFTPAGITVMLAVVNEESKRRGMQVLLEPSDQGGIVAEYTLDIALPRRRPLDPLPSVRHELLSTACGLMASLPNSPSFQVIHLRVLWSTGKLAVAEKFHASDCPRPARAVSTTDP